MLVLAWFEGETVENKKVDNIPSGKPWPRTGQSGGQTQESIRNILREENPRVDDNRLARKYRMAFKGKTPGTALLCQRCRNSCTSAFCSGPHTHQSWLVILDSKDTHHHKLVFTGNLIDFQFPSSFVLLFHVSLHGFNSQQRSPLWKLGPNNQHISHFFCQIRHIAWYLSLSLIGRLLNLPCAL